MVFSIQVLYMLNFIGKKSNIIILKSFIQMINTKGFEMKLGVKSKCYVFIFSLQSSKKEGREVRVDMG